MVVAQGKQCKKVVFLWLKCFWLPDQNLRFAPNISHSSRGYHFLKESLSVLRGQIPFLAHKKKPLRPT